ncbi:hypothetical protein [Robertkochia flava]|uniref:hypothetical protein n=1 Tax=Robertkochia flava TaxID=3447986 RepID=UPI001CC98FE1|nr:hypothetical protein [Robertkochia marina]
MRFRLLIIVLLLFEVSSAQEKSSELILGNWKYIKTIDLRSTNEKSKYEDIPWDPIETDDRTGYPIRTFIENGEFTNYYTNDLTEQGKWEIQDSILILTHRISPKTVLSNKERSEKFVQKGAITKGSDGLIYQQPIEIKIKLLTKEKLELGNEKTYSIHEKIK